MIFLESTSNYEYQFKDDCLYREEMQSGKSNYMKNSVRGALKKRIENPWFMLSRTKKDTQKATKNVDQMK